MKGYEIKEKDYEITARSDTHRNENIDEYRNGK